MARLNATKVRNDFADTLNRVAYRGERIILHRRGKDVAALIPIEDLKLLEELEDRLDAEAARKALAESDERIPYEEVRRKLGLP
ncbi:MAG: type II toxin-antitoxin system prevent-host-death family antitoxin [Deltaproteobacteria bacterium]|nr:type II toxin-antitoxin system prevent-host-death family antitoxin [Deltaproteobacteria bacterium]MBI3079671.1 type II toxin-antitoxin system prevent-host-death family antitoxin [Deltaproteobacteria bacterium]